MSQPPHAPPPTTDGDAGPADESNDLQRAMGHVRTLLTDGENGRAAIEYRARPEFCHSGGVVQGGYITGWIDAAMAHAAITRSDHQLSPATLEIKMVFYKPARPGVLYRAEAWVDRWGRTTAFLEGRLLDPEG